MSDQTSMNSSGGGPGSDVPQGNLSPGNTPASTDREIGDQMPGRTGQSGMAGGNDPGDVSGLGATGEGQAGATDQDQSDLDEVAGRTDPMMDQDDDVGDDTGGGI